MKIPSYARYDFCNKKACEFIEEYNIKSFPIDVENLIHENKWGLVKYSDLMKKFQCDRQTVIRYLGSQDGYTIWNGDNYTIAYNDDVLLGERTRFTLMHEIGHIYLNHLIDFESTQIYRGSLTQSENKVLENEANAFARNVLVPISMYVTIKNKSIPNIARTFGITHAAAAARIDFIDKDVALFKSLNLVQKAMLVYHRFMNKQKCSICNAQFFSKYPYCPICGWKNALQWGDGKMIYKGLDIYENGKLKICPRCNNEETAIKGNSCQICGLHLTNYCSANGCENSYGTPLPSNARYCPVCGATTTFYDSGILKAWNAGSDPFSMIPDYVLDSELPFS